MDDIAIVGIGNPERGDDGVGWAVIDLLENKSDIPLYKVRDDFFELVELFAEHKTVFCIDGCLMKEGYKRIDARKEKIPSDISNTSTHGLNLSQAIAMAESLDQLPSTLIVYAIGIEQYEVGTKISSKVLHQAETIVPILLEDIERCMKKA